MDRKSSPGARPVRGVRTIRRVGLWTLPAIISLVGHAGEADITRASITCPDSCRVEVTLIHQDEDREHYANRWEVQTLAGEVLGSRVLLNPHLDAGPLQSYLENIAVPQEERQVLVRANDTVHGDSGGAIMLIIPEHMQARPEEAVETRP